MIGSRVWHTSYYGIKSIYRISEFRQKYGENLEEERIGWEKGNISPPNSAETRENKTIPHNIF